MKLIIKIISIFIIILTLSEGLSGQNTTNTITPISTNTTNTTTPISTNTTTNETLANTTTNGNTTQPVIVVKQVIPVTVETDPYKLYLCDEKNSSSISIVNKSFADY